MEPVENSDIPAWIKKFRDEPFTSIASNEWYGVADYPEESARRMTIQREFIENPDIQAPVVPYPKLEELRIPGSDHTTLDQLERKYQEILGTLYLADAQGKEGLEEDLSREQVRAKLLELYRHKEVIRGLGRIGLEKGISDDRAARMSIERFGEPEQDDFSHLLVQLRRMSTDKIGASPYAQELLDLTGSVEVESDTPNYELKETTLETLKGDLLDLFPQLNEFVLDETAAKTTAEESIPYFQAMLDAMEITDWKAELSAGKAADTSGAKKKVSVGSKRVPFSPKRLMAIGIHEVIGHGLRAFNSSKQTDKIKQTALPDSLAFEEGLATGFEQIFSGEKRIAGEQYYLSLGLQLGLDRGGEKRNFRETYEILWRRLVVTDAAESVDDAKDQAYQQVMRTTRGGMLDTRDISYFNGAKRAYAWLNEVAELPRDERLKKLQWVLSGRFDPTNPLHQNIYKD